MNWSVPTKSHIFTFWGNLRQMSLKKWKWNSLWLVGSSYRYSPTLTNSPHVRRHIGNISTKMQCDPSVHKAWPQSSVLIHIQVKLHGRLEIRNFSSILTKNVPLHIDKLTTLTLKIGFATFSPNVCGRRSIRHRGGRGRHSLIWPIGGCAAGQGMVLVLSVLNRAYNFARVCPKQGIYFHASLS